MSSLIMSPLMNIAAGAALLIGLAGAAVAADESPASRDVAPTGSLRVAIAVSSPGPLVGSREEQEKFVDQGPFYTADEVPYLVRAGSDIKTIADVDRDGIHIGAIAGRTSHTVAKSLKHATLTTFSKPEAAAELLGQGRLDAFAW